MPTKKELANDIDEISKELKLDGDGLKKICEENKIELKENLEDMSSADLVNLKKALKAVVDKPSGLLVQPGKSVTTKKGIKGPGDVITASMLGGGAEALEQLKKKEIIK